MPPPRSQRISWDRWSEVDDLFARALEQPAAYRQSFVSDACGGDVALLERVSELITASERAEGKLERPADELLREAFGAPARQATRPLGPGDSIGRYRILRTLGSGGMATVYEAERADGTYEQRVAVKLLRREMNTEEIGQRFRVETQILSALAHPNIARLLDAGTTEEGQPFLVMELVVGEPVTAWADRHGLDVEVRLTLFAQVADAVGFAHKHLIVHRDLKPSNVLVGHDGQVKLLDFGIAKLLETDAPDGTDTRPTTRWMTPGYASPEQILARPVTTGTDVHGLGLLLYELLTGRRPFAGDGMSGFDLDRAICEQEPTRPSAVITAEVAETRGAAPDRIRRLLMGDLDAIVSKALRKEPDDRYGSVSAMARDIERHRTGFPVEARAGLRVYAARKFISRHRLGVGATAAIVATLLFSSLILWRQQLAAAEARDQAASAAQRATTEAENAALVIDFLAGVFRGRDLEQAPADTMTARDLLAWGSERVDTEFTDRPALQARLLHVLGSAYSNFGLPEEAVDHLTRSVEQTRQAHGDRSDEVAERLLVLSGAHRASRYAVPALPLAREALAIRRADSMAGDSTVAAAFQELARVHTEMDRPDSAALHLENALDLYRTSVGEESLSYVDAILDLARARRAQGNLEEAARLYGETIPKLRATRSSDVALVGPLNNHAFLLRTLEDYAGAERLYRESLEISTRLYGRGHPASLNVANNLAAALYLQGKGGESVAVMRESAAAAEAQWPDGHWRVGSAYSSVGNLLLRTRKFDEGFAALAVAHGIYTRILGANHMWTYYVEASIAVSYVVNGQEERGQAYLDRFYQYRVDDPPPANAAEHQARVDLLQPFVNLLQDLDLVEEAERFRSLIGSK